MFDSPEIISWKSFEVSLERQAVNCLRGLPLSKRDHIRWCHAMVLWGIVISEQWPGRHTSQSALAFWLRHLCEVDVELVIATLKAAQIVLRYTDTKFVPRSREDFKDRLKSEGCDLQILGPAILQHCYIFAEDPDVSKFRELNQVITFPQRLTLWETEPSDELDSYYDDELYLGALSYAPDLIREMRSVCVPALQDWTYTHPDYNNGATYDVKREEAKALKYHALRPSSALLHVFGDEDMPDGRLPLERSRRIVKVSIAPKTANKWRLICPEDTTHMFYQSGVFEGFDNWFKRHREWNVTLHDQTNNQKLALEGSRTGEYATIDLSAASDLISWKLVKALTIGTPVYPYLMATRTPRAEVDGTVIQLNKFAPMGSRACFPVECFVFSLVCLTAQRRAKSHHQFFVYGDDIVVHESLYADVIDILLQLGMRVNRDKTFPPYSQFTESCGLEAYQGKEITPLRFPRFYDVCEVRKAGRNKKVLRHSTSLSGAVDFANGLYAYGFLKARAYVLRDLGTALKFLPFSFDEDGSVLSCCATNFHLEWRWNRNLQRSEAKVYRLGRKAKWVKNPKYPTVRENRTRGDDDTRYQMTLQKILSSKPF